jgi:hypothetical protein
MDADGSHQLHDLGQPLPSVRTELALDVLRLLYHSLEDENVARPPMMVGEIDVHPHPDEFPALGREVAQMLEKQAGMQPGIHARQVPDVDRVLNCAYDSSF